jgi:hypothetical protein
MHLLYSEVCNLIYSFSKKGYMGFWMIFWKNLSNKTFSHIIILLFYFVKIYFFPVHRSFQEYLNPFLRLKKKKDLESSSTGSPKSKCVWFFWENFSNSKNYLDLHITKVYGWYFIRRLEISIWPYNLVVFSQKVT